MTDLAVLTDTVFCERATETLDTFKSAHDPDGCPIERSQITGLRQIAFNEPRALRDFVESQRKRAEKRLQGLSPRDEDRRHRWQSEIEFWQLILDVCEGRQPKHAWSLAQELEQRRPEEYKLPALPPGARLSKEDNQKRDAVKVRARAWEEATRSAWYRAFFQRFCAHYLYLKAERPESQE